MTEIKLFNTWSTEGIKVEDPGLVAYINLTPVIVPKSGGRHAKKPFYKSKLNITERLINKMFVAGHRGKKHKFTSGRNVGTSTKTSKIVIGAFHIIEEKTKKNPVEIFVKAVENSAPYEEVLTYQRGGIFARESVVTAPQRRVDLALKHIAQGTYKRSVKAKKTAEQSLAEELLAAYKKDPTSFAIQEKTRRDKEATGSR
ncbi:MAG: 30S ribosomal protein S7 [archaeon]